MNKQKKRKQFKNETPKKREVRLKNQREYYADKCSKETPEEKKVRMEKMKETTKKHREKQKYKGARRIIKKIIPEPAIEKFEHEIYNTNDGELLYKTERIMYKTLCVSIRNLMNVARKRGLRNKDIASCSNVGESTITRWELTGRANPANAKVLYEYLKDESKINSNKTYMVPAQIIRILSKINEMKKLKKEESKQKEKIKINIEIEKLKVELITQI